MALKRKLIVPVTFLGIGKPVAIPTTLTMWARYGRSRYATIPETAHNPAIKRNFRCAVTFIDILLPPPPTYRIARYGRDRYGTL